MVSKVIPDEQMIHDKDGNPMDILINPAPSAGHTFAYEYMSKNWCESSGGTDQAAWAALVLAWMSRSTSSSWAVGTGVWLQSSK